MIIAGNSGATWPGVIYMPLRLVSMLWPTHPEASGPRIRPPGDAGGCPRGTIIVIFISYNEVLKYWFAGQGGKASTRPDPFVIPARRFDRHPGGHRPSCADAADASAPVNVSGLAAQRRARRTHQVRPSAGDRRIRHRLAGYVTGRPSLVRGQARGASDSGVAGTGPGTCPRADP